MIIHTPAPIEELTAIVGTRGIVIAGRAIATGGPDCFAGWYEPATGDECLPNNIVRVDRAFTIEEHEVTRSVADDLFHAGHQVVVCDKDASGNDVPIEDGTMPIRYQMNHSH